LFIIITILISIILFSELCSIFKPVGKFNSHLEKLADGEYTNLPEITHPEFRSAFSNLNVVSNRLQRYSEKLSKQKEGFNIILETINEAIWIQNSKGFIKTCNQGFLELTEQRSVKDQYFWNVIRENELYEICDEIYKNPQNITQEIKLKNQYFICSASYSTVTEETVFILYDITEIRQLEIIKRDFVLNVSHELRTPLTSLKGYLETLESELTDEQLAYVEVINRNTDRLINIVNDLLTLSRLEHLQNLEIEKININDFLQNIRSIFEYRLKKKKLELIFEIKAKNDNFQADHFKFEQVIINLIDNAIKYTDNGNITVSVFEKEDNLIFEISDTGNGIPAEHIPRLFERFYVVDKSRSRRMGGTGLGLSIVKHIINLHEGAIEVKSVIGEGTTFVISIPKI
jgi:two-component system phosphate regulon sensor histidine kinase PhoR